MMGVATHGQAHLRRPHTGRDGCQTGSLRPLPTLPYHRHPCLSVAGHAARRQEPSPAIPAAACRLEPTPTHWHEPAPAIPAPTRRQEPAPTIPTPTRRQEPAPASQPALISQPALTSPLSRRSSQPRRRLLLRRGSR